jgi:hypothetical protein
MAAMKRRVLPVLLLLYVSADFSNPMMPGAVSFDPDESVSAVRVDRARANEPVVGVSPLPNFTILSLEKPALRARWARARTEPEPRVFAPRPAHVTVHETPPAADAD